MNILIITPYRDEDRYISKEDKKYFTHTSLTSQGINYMTPVEVAYLSAILKNSGHTVTFIDCNNNQLSPEDVLYDGFDVLIVGTCPFDKYQCATGYYEHTIDYLKKFKGKKIVYGPHATTNPELFWDFADVVIQGEPEYKILSALGGEDIKALPVPDLEIYDLDLYKGEMNPSFLKSGRIIALSMTRGCPFQCSFCFHKMFPHKVWSHSFEDIEIILKKSKELKTGGIIFLDKTFTWNKEWTLRFCEIIKPLGIPYQIETRVDKLDVDLISALLDSGCQSIVLGIETGSDELLKSMNKQISWKSVESVVGMCRALGVPELVTYRVAFVPGETRDTLRDTKKRFALVGFDTSLHICVPYPGTAVWNQGVKEGKINPDKNPWMQIHKVAGTIGTKFSREDVFKLASKNDGLLNVSWRVIKNEGLMTFCKLAWRKIS